MLRVQDPADAATPVCSRGRVIPAGPRQSVPCKGDGATMPSPLLEVKDDPVPAVEAAVKGGVQRYDPRDVKEPGR